MWFALEGVEAVDQLDFLNPGWHAYAAKEHVTVREGAALIDQTSFAKFKLFGHGALATLQRLTACNMDRPAGSVIYAQMCNERGGIEADLTITRLGSGHLLEVTSSRAVINLCGPKARDVLARVCEEDVSNVAFPFATSQEIVIGAAPVRAIRIGFVGELGWELHVPTEFGAHVYETLWQAGRSESIRNVGYRAIDSLRMEKGYLYWSGDISPDYNPLEAGLDFRVHLKSGGEFIGRSVLEQQKTEGPGRRLCTFVSDIRLPLFEGETVLHAGQTVSLVTSCSYGYTVGKMIMRAYLDRGLWDEEAFSVEVFGDHHPMTQVSGPLYDPDNKRLKV